MLQTDGIGLFRVFSFSFVSSSAVEKVKILKKNKNKKTREHTGTRFSADGLACVDSIAYVTIECGPRPS